MKKIIALTILLGLSSSVLAQNTLYKCKTPEGGVMLSDTKCVDAERTVAANATTKSANAQSGEELCKAAVIAALPDPDSAKFGSTSIGGYSVITYRGVRVSAKRLNLAVNARNSNGGYTGEKIYPCFVSAQGDRFLMLEN